MVGEEWVGEGEELRVDAGGFSVRGESVEGKLKVEELIVLEELRLAVAGAEPLEERVRCFRYRLAVDARRATIDRCRRPRRHYSSQGEERRRRGCGDETKENRSNEGKPAAY